MCIYYIYIYPHYISSHHIVISYYEPLSSAITRFSQWDLLTININHYSSLINHYDLPSIINLANTHHCTVIGYY